MRENFNMFSKLYIKKTHALHNKTQLCKFHKGIQINRVSNWARNSCHCNRKRIEFVKSHVSILIKSREEIVLYNLLK